MPELNVIHIIVTAALAVLGIVTGWTIRGKRAATEKSVTKAGWQEQLNAQRTEHDRLTEQNKALMEQISQYLAANRDARNRAKQLAEELREVQQGRDQLQAEIADIRGNLEASISECDKLRSDADAQAATADALESKDAEIEKLRKSLESWQSRLPPLIEKYTQRNKEAEQLETELAAARERIAELEEADKSSQTLVEPVHHPEELTDGMGASNEVIEDDENALEGFFDDALSTLQVDFQELVSREDILDPDDDAQNSASGAADDDADEYSVEDTKGVVEIDLDDDATETEDPDEDQPDEDDDADDRPLRDNLRKIKGIGPAIQKTLNELGIFRYQQIADMSEYDIDRIAKRLKGFRSRIYREDWIGQARELRDSKYGD